MHDLPPGRPSRNHILQAALVQRVADDHGWKLDHRHTRKCNMAQHAHSTRYQPRMVHDLYCRAFGSDQSPEVLILRQSQRSTWQPMQIGGAGLGVSL